MGILQVIKFYFKQLTCKHTWRYWNVRLHSDRSNIEGKVLPRWRKCNVCHKQEKTKMTPGDWKWVKSTKQLPNDTDIVDVNVRAIGEPETKQEKRNRLINNILKK